MRPTPRRTQTRIQPTSENEESLRQERDALLQERDSLFDRLARTTADFQNARRRLEADKDQAVAFANSALIKSLLARDRQFRAGAGRRAQRRPMPRRFSRGCRSFTISG